MSNELKITDGFLAFLRNKAYADKDIAGQSGRYDDGGCSRTLELIAAYDAGRKGLIPSFWVEDLKAFHSEQDPEFATYKRLQQKFEK